jgi:hypothetical protein
MRHESHSTPSGDGDSGDARGQGACVIAVRSTTVDGLEEELRDSLLAALADGAREIVLDLHGVEVITSTSRGLLEAVGATVADRGGVLLVLTGGQMDGEPYVMREIRGAARERSHDGVALAGPAMALR